MVGKERNFGLDVVRTISIWLVLLSHKFPFDVELGVIGVQIFFILSGFLIGQILIRDFALEGKFATVINFWKRRWYRTLPMYYLVLLYKLFFYSNPYGWKIIVYFLFLQANFVGVSFFGVSWSLVVEEWFYIFLPLSTLFFFRRGIQTPKFLKFLLGNILFFFVVRFLWNYCQKGSIIYQFDCLLLGVLLALIKLRHKNIFDKLNHPAIFFLALVGIVLLSLNLGRLDLINLYNTYYRVTWYFLISCCIMFTIPFVEQSAMINKKIKKFGALYYFFTWTSVLTYSIYLLHMEVFRGDFGLGEGMELFIQVPILYTISFIIYAIFESPIMSLRDEFSLKQYLNTFKSFSFKI